ncbi:heme NO-binding domain-containing protein [Roseovarius pelagicus]|uniref:Heme NO-binding domain-containing protein n=1 Tax=Roseovarius pelagicus TaxID=2980108 RepID=A0ABY6D9P5_9RHOB|nr:heme NO-binding domain-containing protein [Roseovarius pelagicus]UXX82822.1 heme NO-binding domain-containing protein [Roseovarius pelagicus]
MHGLINRAIERFVRDTYGRDTWQQVMRRAALDYNEFEAMLTYDDHVTVDVLVAAQNVLDRPVADILEDIGTYLVSHPKVEALRRLLRFGGSTFTEFLHSLDDLPARARLAVSDLDLPQLELREHAADSFSLICQSRHAGFGHVIVGLLRALADDYGALVLLEHKGGGAGREIIEIQLLSMVYASGRQFDLGARAE